MIIEYTTVKFLSLSEYNKLSYKRILLYKTSNLDPISCNLKQLTLNFNLGRKDRKREMGGGGGDTRLYKIEHKCLAFTFYEGYARLILFVWSSLGGASSAKTNW